MKNKSLTLAIVIPAYNEEGYLKACLDSIANQSVMPDEVIVVDNNSTDDTAAIASRYSFVTLIKESRQGVVFARNRGFDASASVLIARIDADSFLPIDWVEKVKSIYIDAGLPEKFAASGVSDFRNRGWKFLWFAMHRLAYFWFGRLLLGHQPFFGANMFLTRQLWLSVRNEVCLRTDIHEDMDLAWHCTGTGAQLAFSSHLKNTVVFRHMDKRLISYPMMMIRLRLIRH